MQILFLNLQLIIYRLATGSNIQSRHLSQEGCFSLKSALKPEAEMVSEVFRGRYDLDKLENITNRYRQ